MLNESQIQQLHTVKVVNSLEKREQRYQYFGILQEYQLYGKSHNKILDYTKLNPHQHFLFKRVLHGLNMYSKEEIETMHWDKKKRIKKVWRKGQKVINEWKQLICNKIANTYFLAIFGEDAKAIYTIPENEILESYTNPLSLKELGITYEDVILKFIQTGLLPKNFLSLK